MTRKLIHSVMLITHSETHEVARCSPRDLDKTVKQIVHTAQACGFIVYDNKGVRHDHRSIVQAQHRDGGPGAVAYVKVDTY